MTTYRVGVTVIAVLLAGHGSASAEQTTEKERVRSLLTTLEEEPNERLRKKAVEELVARNNQSTPLLIDAFRRTKSRPAKEALVYVLSRKKDERTKATMEHREPS